MLEREGFVGCRPIKIKYPPKKPYTRDDDLAGINDSIFCTEKDKVSNDRSGARIAEEGRHQDAVIDGCHEESHEIEEDEDGR